MSNGVNESNKSSQSVSKWLSENTRDVEWKGWDRWEKKRKEIKEKDLAYYVTDHFYLGWDSMDKKLGNGIFVVWIAKNCFILE